MFFFCGLRRYLWGIQEGSLGIISLRHTHCRHVSFAIGRSDILGVPLGHIQQTDRAPANFAGPTGSQRYCVA